MTSEMLRAAVRNNALWCNGVCEAHGVPGEFSATLWLHRQGTPAFYPDVITLTGADTAREQEEAIAVLIRSRKGGWGVKDSYAALDLAPFGFQILFGGEWIGIEAADMHAPNEQSLIWKRITTAVELEFWQRAWSGGDPPKTMPIFANLLLRNEDIAFLGAFENGALCGGGILNRQSGVVGHSNVFAIKRSDCAIRAGLVQKAGEIFPGMPIVGYEHGEDLTRALELGFTSLGPLRVWVRS
ncbi:hypothetical protein [Rhizobium azibense]|uniref:N-acetyltransferase domain-containing protein n=1 Tax=Rhizobium azibense TaxID=1136135 RepID=A0A4R3RF99_9HYPH|nr:hypothetical protein [Rhizobium azibense]TCU33244.1 hypothetical protein EV129_1162 [Rhizobium azibense]